MSNRCMVCGKEISPEAKRCKSCAAKVRWQDPTYCRKQSEDAKTMWRDPEHCRKMSESMKASWERGDFDHPDLRRKRSEAARAQWERGNLGTPDICQRLSKAARARWQNPEYRHKMEAIFQAVEYRCNLSNRTAAQWQNLEVRRKMLEGIRASHARGDYNGNVETTKAAWIRGVYDDPAIHRKMSEGARAAHIRGIYDGVFISPTSIEVAVATALDAHNIAHVPQFRPEGCRFIFDEFIFPGLLLEINGTYWHGPEHPKQQERDIIKAAWAEENGFALIVIWEHEIKEQGAQALVIERVKPLLAEGEKE